MAEHLVFLTGQLARPRVEAVLAGMEPTDFSYEIQDVGVKVAALMTERLIRRRVATPLAADRVVLPGRFRGDLEALSAHYGVPVERGPDDIDDLPEHFGRERRAVDLSRHDVRIFAEIVDATALSVEQIVARARQYRADGADVIDLGCLPDTPFPHLEEAIAALADLGLETSVDSSDRGELRRGARAGARYLLSLDESSLELAEETEATPILVPARHGDLGSLLRAMEELDRRGRRYLADPILDPIHFGFSDSLGRYAELRRRRPDAPILMGTGNLTELTDADTSGVNALLMGLVSELRIGNVLVVQVSPHCRRAIRETDAARRMMFAAREGGRLPSGIDPGLLCLRDRKPHPVAPAEIAALAERVADRNWRIQVAEDGIHAYNRDAHLVGADPYELFPDLGVEDDAAHAFYLGVETAKAEIAARLGKRYTQDEPLAWGVAVDRPEEDLTVLKAAGPTLRERERRRRQR